MQCGDRLRALTMPAIGAAAVAASPKATMMLRERSRRRSARHGVVFAVGLSCCPGTALGDGPQRLGNEPEHETPAVARTAEGSDARAAEDDSDLPDAHDDVPWWRSHLRIEAAARVGGDIWIGTAGPGIHTVSSFGAGGGASVAIDRVHLGLSAMYYLAADGSSVSRALAPGEGEAVYWSLLVGTELGYDFRVGIWTFRPQLGFGAHELHAIFTDFGNEPMQRWDAYLEPGVTTLLKLGFVTLGLDTNVLVVTTTARGNTPTLTAHGELGLAFP